MQLDSRQLDQLFGTFFDITSLLHAGREEVDIFARVLDCACQLLHADRCTLLLAHDGKLHRFSLLGSSPEMDREELPENPALLSWIEKEARPFLGGPGEWHPPATTELLLRGDASLVCAPLVAKESHLGLLLAIRDGTPNGFEAGHLNILTALANQTAIAVENADLYERLKHEAITDGLTGVFNYKTLMQTLRTELRRAQRYGHPVTFVMADVDYLKRYNDRFGHLAGSEVLAQLARLLAGNCRNTDIVGKYGGDEFAIILPQTGIGGAVNVAERMRAAIAAHQFDNVDAGDITCSFGIAAFPEDGVEPYELICVADQRLFQAKRAGKNTLCSTSAPTVEPVFQSAASRSQAAPADSGDGGTGAPATPATVEPAASRVPACDRSRV